jgi:probable F420-dependent oxidoreductase
MANTFRFSTSMPALGGSAAAWRDKLRRIEDMGYWSVAISDHFTAGWMMDPIVVMTAAVEATTSLRILPLVLANDYRHPVLLHKALATLDVLSAGRIEIGLGAGWMQSDYAAANIPYDPAPTRIARLAESIEVIKGLFGPKPLTYVGEHYQITELEGLPKPVQQPHPQFLIGGGGRRVLELAGRAADIVGLNPVMRRGRSEGLALLDLTGEGVRKKVDIARAAARAAGRDPDVLRYQMSIRSVDISDAPDAQPWVSSMASEVTDPAVLADSPAVLHGTVASCVEALQRRRDEFGLDYIHIGGDPRAAAPIVARIAGT